MRSDQMCEPSLLIGNQYSVSRPIIREDLIEPSEKLNEFMIPQTLPLQSKLNDIGHESNKSISHSPDKGNFLANITNFYTS